MSSHTSADEIFASLGSESTRLLGQPETEWLDFKADTYALSAGDHVKFELAKDVSALANAGGGVIVLGIRTELSVAAQEEIAKELRPLPVGSFDRQQVANVIGEWVYPRLDIRIASFPQSGGGDIWTIHVHGPHDRDLPYIVARESRNGRTYDRALFGVYKRSGTHNAPYASSQVHQWLHAMWAAEYSATRQGDVSRDTSADRALSDDADTLGLIPEDMHYFVQIAPAGDTALREFHDGSPQPIQRELLALRSTQLRYDGFNLRFGQAIERTSFGGYRTTRPESGSVSVEQNGLLTVIFHHRLLTWSTAHYSHDGTILNPIAVVEPTLEAARFYCRAIAPRAHSQARCRWRLGFRGAFKAPVHLPSRRLGPDRDPAVWLDSLGQIKGPFATEWAAHDGRSAEALAFAMLAEAYSRFGLDSATILFASNGIVSESEVKALGS